MTQPITLVHVVRHGEVYNPQKILYGRLPDYHLSDLGVKMAERVAESFAGHDITPMEGRSLVPALLNQPAEPRTLILEHEHNAAIRQGNWKLVGKDVLARDGLRAGGRWER